MATHRHAITVLGAGSWGSALAIQLARNGHRVRLWGRSESALREMERRHENRQYLPGAPFPTSLTIAPKLEAALEKADFLLVVVPSLAFSATIAKLRSTDTPLFWGTKGLDPSENVLLHETAATILGPDRGLGVVSGPSFAAEVARGLPTALTVAATSSSMARQFAALLHGGNMRAYTSTDVVGVEIGGATKNVIAIAAGIADGLGFGANARAGLITRGLAEIRRLGKKLGARPSTLTGLSGLGDLVLTCTDNQSRNRRFGLLLGSGLNVEQSQGKISGAIEGITAASCVTNLAQKLSVEMPISNAVYNVLNGRYSPQTAVSSLMGRPMKAER